MTSTIAVAEQAEEGVSAIRARDASPSAVEGLPEAVVDEAAVDGQGVMAIGQRATDDPCPGQGERVDSFFRLFGDADGDGNVDLGDVLRFAGTVGKRAGDPGYLWYFDYDSDGRLDGSDLV